MFTMDLKIVSCLYWLKIRTGKHLVLPRTIIILLMINIKDITIRKDNHGNCQNRYLNFANGK